MAALPIIPVAPFLSANKSASSCDNKERVDTAKALHAACRDYGFFYLNLEGFITKEETVELTRLAREFFSSPQEVKDLLSLRNSDQARGIGISILVVIHYSLCALLIRLRQIKRERHERKS
jgi:isopenicillin N synthase-like dioxygenase